MGIKSHFEINRKGNPLCFYVWGNNLLCFNEMWLFNIFFQEHPVLGCPFFYLHPCHTADLMKNTPAVTDKRYVIMLT